MCLYTDQREKRMKHRLIVSEVRALVKMVRESRTEYDQMATSGNLQVRVAGLMAQVQADALDSVYQALNGDMVQLRLMGAMPQMEAAR